MYLRKVKRKCSVRGCKNTQAYAVSRTREAGNSIIMCKQCMEEAAKAVQNFTEPPKTVMKSPPDLFFENTAKSEETTDKTEQIAVNSEETDTNSEQTDTKAEETAVKAEETTTTARKRTRKKADKT